MLSSKCVLSLAIITNVCNAAQAAFVSSMSGVGLARGAGRGAMVLQPSVRSATVGRDWFTPLRPACSEYRIMTSSHVMSLELKPLRLRGGGLRRAWKSSSASFRGPSKDSTIVSGGRSAGAGALPEDSTATSAAHQTGSSWANVVAGNQSPVPTAEDKAGNAGIATTAEQNYTNGEGDAYYFNSYSHFGIHEEMLKDEVCRMSIRPSHSPFIRQCLLITSRARPPFPIPAHGAGRPLHHLAPPQHLPAASARASVLPRASARAAMRCGRGGGGCG